jgi:hypothetical protein
LSHKHAAKHRSAPAAPFHARFARRLRGAAILSGVAVAATGIAVSTGVLAQSSPVDGAAAALSSSASADSAKGMSTDELADREERASRSTADRRPETDRTKARTLAADAGVAVTRSADVREADPKSVARALMPKYGMSASEFSCLDSLWEKESGWSVNADNPTSSAYGIPQALPGSKMASAGPNWENNPETQIRWGLGYIKDRYGSACSAWGHSQSNNWY